MRVARSLPGRSRRGGVLGVSLSSMLARSVSPEHDDAAKYRKFGEDRLRQKKTTTLNFG